MANRLNDLRVFPVELFDWKKNDTKWTGCAELSDLGGSPFHRLYEEKPGWGFSVKGREKTLTFSITDVVRDHYENEALYFNMKCISDMRIRLILFND